MTGGYQSAQSKPLTRLAYAPRARRQLANPCEGSVRLVSCQAMPSLPLTLLPLLAAPAAPATPPGLFPLPSNCSQGATALTVAKNVSVVLDSASSPADLTADSLVSGILSRYQQLLRSKVSWTGAEGAPSAGGELGATAAALAVVTAKITSADLDLGPETDESYAVTVTTSPPAATVTAKTAFGLRHGLETLAQLVVTPQGTIQAPVTISDSPKFPYRGLMIDTGRHFLSVDTIKRAIDGMATLKLYD